MSTNMYGANPEQLTALGRSLQQQIESDQRRASSTVTVRARRHDVDGPGPGPVRAGLEHDVPHRAHAPRTRRSTPPASDCITRSTELQRVMGAG